MPGYTIYEESDQLQLLLPPKKTYCKTCCNITCSFLSYLLVAYISADAALLECFKTNCTLPHNINFTDLNGTAITLHNKQIIDFLYASEGVVGFFLALIMFCQCIKYLNVDNCC